MVECKHDWEQHITSYRCGVDEYAKKCKKCGKWVDIGIIYQDEQGNITREEWYEEGRSGR